MDVVVVKAKTNAQIHAERRAALLAIQQRNADKLLVPSEVVDEARDPASPIHECFTWDDSVAAEKWRIEEAGVLIRSVVIEYDPRWNSERVPQFVSLSCDRNRDGGGYRRTDRVLSSARLRAELELTAKKELSGWLERHRLLTELVNPVAKAAGLSVPGSPGVEATGS